MLAETEELLVDELEVDKSAVRSQSIVSLVVPDVAPDAVICVPDEPVWVLPRAIDAELLSSQNENLPVPVEK